MMQVTVEFGIKPGMEKQFEAALERAHAGIEKYDGFLGEEPCSNLFDDGKFVTLFYFRDRASITAWRNDPDHRQLQTLGKNEIFSWYRIRIGEIEREYAYNEAVGSGLPCQSPDRA